jgi:hypothetical protein
MKAVAVIWNALALSVMPALSLSATNAGGSPRPGVAGAEIPPPAAQGGGEAVPVAPAPPTNLYYIVERGRYGFMDATGRVVVAPVYREAHLSFSEGRAGVRTDAGWGYVDLEGREVVKPRFDAASPFAGGRARVQIRGQWGFVDPSGAQIIPAEYAKATSFAEGRAGVGRPGHRTPSGTQVFACGYIDAAGRAVGRPQFNYAGEIREGRGRVNVGGAWGWDTVVGGRWGFADTDGRVVIPAEYDRAEDFAEERAAVRRDKLWGFIDRDGKTVAECRFSKVMPFAGGRAVVTTPESKQGVLDREGRLVVPARFDRVYPFREGVARVVLDLKVGYVDREGKVIREPEFAEGLDFSEGLAAVRPVVKGKWGFLDREGRLAIEPQYPGARSFAEGLAPVCHEAGAYSDMGVLTWGRWGYIDRTGALVMKLPWYQTYPYMSGFAVGGYTRPLIILRDGQQFRRALNLVSGDRPFEIELEGAGEGLVRVKADTGRVAYLTPPDRVVWAPTE